MIRRVLRRLAGPVVARIDRRIDDRVEQRGTEPPPAPARTTYVPPIEWVQTSADAPFLASSTCSVADFVHPRYRAICEQIGQRPIFHRKQWEHVFILGHLERAGLLGDGSRGLAFGVGSEPLPAAFAAAGSEICATDAPPSIGHGSGWVDTNEYADGLAQLRRDDLIDAATLARRVTYRVADMNSIPDDLEGFDFCWSACCFEHLGSLQHGVNFVIDSVERCLRPGGVAVHTTELNLSSDDDTFESPDLSIYRRRDIEELVDTLRSRGHEVEPFRIAPDSHHLDHVVDVPPYHHDPHIKLELAGYVVTSVGLVITRGS